ncbi:MAG TPA: hypothetical protein QGH16_05000 [Verrucomicrobiota bacterium]|jgi:hypothetical protein|nr:hypothetical protein [Verrucomicrobiota bacterium]
MKRFIQTFACSVLAVVGLSLSALGQAQDDSPVATLDLEPVLERLDQVIAGLAKVSGNLSKLQNVDSGNVKDQSLKTVSRQLGDLNAAVESLTGQLAVQTKATGVQGAAAGVANDLLKQLIFLQKAAAAKANQPMTKPQWEYKSIFGDSRVALEEEMNLFGRDGWEFFNITSFGRGTAAFARRPAK